MGRLTTGGQTALGNGVSGPALTEMLEEAGMAGTQIPSIGRIIAATINEKASGDPDALAAHIVAALAEAGFRIVSDDGREDTALGPSLARPERRNWRG